MRIGDAAAAAGTTPRALRFYEQRGLLPPPRRTRTGQRLYGEEEVARVRVIRELLAHGLTVEDVAVCADRLHLLEDDVLSRYGQGVCTRTSGVVERRIAALDAEIARLTALRDRLDSVRMVPSTSVHVVEAQEPLQHPPGQSFRRSGRASREAVQAESAAVEHQRS